MSYPILPMAIVTFLAGISEERATLRKGPRHVTVLAHHNETVRSVRFEIENDGHWSSMVERSVQLFNEGDVDTMTVIYPADGDDPVDFGIILEGLKEPSCFQWGYSPKFDVRLAPTNVIESIRRGIGVETLQSLLDKSARDAAKRAPVRMAGISFTQPPRPAN